MGTWGVGLVATIGLPCSFASTTARLAQAMTMRPAAAAVCGISRAEKRQPVALQKAAAKARKATAQRPGPTIRSIERVFDRAGVDVASMSATIAGAGFGAGFHIR